jgi:hypothetical protein
MADFSIASQVRPVQLPDQLQQFGQFNQIALQQAQMAKAQSDAEAQNRLRSLDRNSPEFLNQLYAIDPAKGMAFEKGVADLAEAKRKRGEAAYDRGVAAKKEAELARIFGGVNNLMPAAPAAPAAPTNNLVAPAAPQMSFGAGVGEYTPAAAPAAPAAAAPAAAPSPSSPDYASIINNLVRGGHLEEAKKIADLAKTSAEGAGKAVETSVARMKAAYDPIQTLIQHVATPADVEAYTRRIYSDPILGPEASRLKSVDQAVQDNLDLVSKVGLDQWKARNSNMDAKQLHDLVTTATAPKIEKVDRGGSIVFMDMNPKSPTYRQTLDEIQKTLTPEQTAKRAAEEDPIKIQETFDKTLDNLVDQYRKLGEKGMLIKPGETSMGNRAAAVASVAAPELTTIFSPDRASGVAAIANMRQTALTALMGATGMSAKQIDSNAEMKAYLNSLSNPSQPVEAIVDTLNNLSQRFGRGKKLTVDDITGGITQNPSADSGVPTGPRARRGTLTPPPAAAAPTAVNAPAAAAPNQPAKPTLDQFLARVKPLNPNASTEDLTAYYNRTYGGR